MTEPPPVLRCGLARGTVFSVDNRNDFVGSRINPASSLQKLPGIAFAFNRRGIKTGNAGAADFFRPEIVVKRTALRGIGDKGLACIPGFEFDAMPAADRSCDEDVQAAAT